MTNSEARARMHGLIAKTVALLKATKSLSKQAVHAIEMGDEDAAAEIIKQMQLMGYESQQALEEAFGNKQISEQQPLDEAVKEAEASNVTPLRGASNQ